MELLEDIPVDEQLLRAVSELSHQGYQLALDDYTFEPAHEPLLPWMNFIKLEVPALSLEQIRRAAPALQRRGLKLLAEKIETEQEYRQLRELGVDYFQGYYFSRPKVLTGRRLEENQLVILRLVSELNNPEVTLDALDRLISQDAGFSYKILRYINSSAMGMPRQVGSIRQAVVYMGMNRIRAWASLLALSRLHSRPKSKFTTALVRAHMCEQLITRTGGCVPETAFTVGLLSILDLLMDRPLSEILAELALSDEIRIALLESRGAAGQALRCTLAYEFQQWDDIGFGAMRDEEIMQVYLQASEKAFTEEQALQSA